jgi:hypothetical protein
MQTNRMSCLRPTAVEAFLGRRLTLQWCRRAAVPNPALRASEPLARRRHAGCYALPPNARSVPATVAPRRLRGRVAARSTLESRYSDRATARMHLSAARCVIRPAKANRSPRSQAALRARSLARSHVLTLRGRPRQECTQIRRAVLAGSGVRHCRRKVNCLPRPLARLFGALADATGLIIVFSRPGELTRTTKDYHGQAPAE